MGIKVVKPGLLHYVNMINEGCPFSFVRYGEGEIKWLVPSLATKKGYPSFAPEYVREELEQTVIQHHDDPQYIPAIQHRWHFKELGKLAVIEKYFARVAPGRKWHWAGVFRRATLQTRFLPMIRAIQKCPLPFILVGPKRIELMATRLLAHRHIITDPKWAYGEMRQTENQIMEIGEPALISFSCSFAAKVLIHRLFPAIGQHTTMIDFGSLWDGYVGLNKRPYHPKMNNVLIRRNLGI